MDEDTEGEGEGMGMLSYCHVVILESFSLGGGGNEVMGDCYDLSSY